jgi:uncharacterized protein (DUF1810 family)
VSAGNRRIANERLIRDGLIDVADPFDLARFVAAQDEGGVYERALSELTEGRKRTHWMWFVFPQIAGLGSSQIARRFAIGSLVEARAVLDHEVLGPRLHRCVLVLDRTRSGGAVQIFGEVDALKLRSCLTLFMRADPSQKQFADVLERYFDGVPDPATDELL